jgi:hypothetical protein
MRRIALLCSLIVLLFLLNACGGGPLHVEISSTCRLTNTHVRVCTVTLKNAPDSGSDFNWAASSEPGVAIFSAAAGTVSPGSSSDPISVNLPGKKCPVTLIFTDTLTGTTFQDRITDCQSSMTINHRQPVRGETFSAHESDRVGRS